MTWDSGRMGAGAHLSNLEEPLRVQMRTDKVKSFIRGNPWGMSSLVITAGSAILIFCIIDYLDSQGLWYGNVRAQTVLWVWEIISTVLSPVTALVGLKRDASKALSIVALCLSMLNFLFYGA